MNARVSAVLAVVALLPFAGCLEDMPTPIDDEFPTGAQELTLPPEIPIPSVIKGIEHVAQAFDDEGSPAPTSGGMDVLGHYAYVPGHRTGFYVVDIIDPENPTIVGKLGPNLGTDDTAVLARFVTMVDLGGRIIAVAAGQGSGMHFIDVTVPTEPTLLTTITMPDNQPVHNVIAVPGTTLVYNTPSTGVGGVNHIIDLRDPESPEVVGKFGDHGCHLTDIRVDLHRAYCAGVQESQIWDIADPLNPTLVSRIDSPLIAVNDVRFPPIPRPPEPVPPLTYPARVYGLHHQAYPSQDGKILLITDEHNGGGEPGGCVGTYQDPVTGESRSTPLGAVWFFDISNEKEPALLGWFSPPRVEPTTNPGAQAPAAPVTPLPNCTAHIGVLVPGKQQTLIGWYHSGAVLVDFSDPANPYMVARWNDNTNTWNLKIHQGWIVTGDISRGSDVLRFV